MLFSIALWILQDRASPPAVAQPSVHTLVEELPRFGEDFWDVGPHRAVTPSIRAQRALRERLQRGARLDLEDWKTILIEKGYLRWRARWPVDHAFAVGLQLPALQDGLGIELTPVLAGGTPARAFCRELFAGCCLGVGDEKVVGNWHPLGWLDRGQRTLALELRVIGSSQPLGVLDLQLEPVAGVEDALIPTEAPRWGAALARCLSIDDPGFSARLFVGDWEQPNWLACSLDIELLHDGGVVEVTRSPLRAWAHETLPLHHLPRPIARGEAPAKGWSLRVRGTSKNVLRNWDATQYWAGEIDVPLADLIRR